MSAVDEPVEPVEPEAGRQHHHAFGPSDAASAGHPEGGAAPGATEAPAAPPPVQPKEHRASRWVRWWRSPPLRWAITIVVLLFVLEYLLLPDIASARKSITLLGRVNVAGLLIATGLEVLSLLAYAELTHTVLSPGAPGRFRLFRVNMSSLAVSHVLPGGTAPGTAVSYRLLTTDLDVPPATAAFGLAVQGVGSAVVLNVIFWLALLISIPLSGYNKLYGFGALAGAVLFGLFGATVALLTSGESRVGAWLHRAAARLPFVDADRLTNLVQTIADRLRILLRDRSLRRMALEWAAANWLLDAASLWVFVFAFGKAVSPVDLLVAYGLANVLAVLPITPGGLGVVEGILIPTLVGFHVPKPIAILGVLSYRLVNFWLPIPAGGGAYLSLRFGSGTHRPHHQRLGHNRARTAPDT